MLKKNAILAGTRRHPMHLGSVKGNIARQHSILAGCPLKCPCFNQTGLYPGSQDPCDPSLPLFLSRTVGCRPESYKKGKIFAWGRFPHPGQNDQIFLDSWRFDNSKCIFGWTFELLKNQKVKKMCACIDLIFEFFLICWCFWLLKSLNFGLIIGFSGIDDVAKYDCFVFKCMAKS